MNMDWNKISTLLQLKEAADRKKSVIVPKSHPWSKPRPAAVLLFQQGASLLRLFEMGMYIYKPNKKTYFKFKKEESK